MYMLFIEGELNPGKKDDFLKAWNRQILPLLKKQDGFVDEILLFEEESQHPRGLSFWETKEQAERYRRDVFPQAKNFVHHLMHGRPTIRNFQVAAAETFKITSPKAA
jgi:heme-degrading monooxygenase HmoA